MGLPLQFSGNNLVKSIRSGTPQDSQSLRLVVDLTEKGKTKAVKQQNGAKYTGSSTRLATTGGGGGGGGTSALMVKTTV